MLATILCLVSLSLGSSLYVAAEVEKEGFWSVWHSEPVESLSKIQDSTITLIHPVDAGRIWIATTEAIYLLRGSSLERFDVPWSDGFTHPRDRVIGMLETTNSNTYVLSRDGSVFRNNPRRKAFERVAETTSVWSKTGIIAFDALADGSGAILLSGSRVLFFDAASESVSEIAISSSTESMPLAIASGWRSDVFIIDSDGTSIRMVWSSLGGWKQSKSAECKLNSLPVGRLEPIGREKFIGISRSQKVILLRINGSECTKLETPTHIAEAIKGRTPLSVRHLKATESIAVATDKGLVLSSKTAVDVLDTDNSSLLSNEITSVAEIGRDRLLVGSFRGIAQLAQLGFRSIAKIGQETLPEVTSIDSHRDAGTFVATYKNVYRVEHRVSGLRFQQVGLPTISGGISALSVSADTLVVGTTAGRFYMLSTDSLSDLCNHVTKPQIDTAFTDITALPDSTFLISALNGRMYRIDECVLSELERPQPVIKDPNRKAIISIESVDGELYFFDFWGAYVIHDRLALDNSTRDSLGDFEASFQNTWLITRIDQDIVSVSPDGHLRRTLRDVSRSSAKTDLSVGESVFAAETDSLGRAWLAASSNLYVIDEQFKLIPAISSHSLNGITFDYGASHSTHDGILYFGGTGGLVVVNNPSAFPIRRSGRIYIRELNAAGKTLEFNPDEERYSVSVDSRNPAIVVALGVPMAPKATPAQIKVELTPNSGTVTQLPDESAFRIVSTEPGTYTFRARGVDPLGVWSDNEIVIPITVLPPPWRSGWAYALYLITFLTMAFLFVRYREEQVRTQTRLAQAKDDGAALLRMEDERQEQQECTERLLNAVEPRSLELLGSVSTSLEAHAAASPGMERGALRELDASLAAIKILERLSTHTVMGDYIDAHRLTDELVASAIELAPSAADAIVLNDTLEVDIPARHARYLALVLHELLLALLRRVARGDSDLLRFQLIPPAAEATSEERYRILADNQDAGPLSEDVLEPSVPVTLHLVESLGGRITLKSEFGVQLEVEVPLD